MLQPRRLLSRIQVSSQQVTAKPCLSEHQITTAQLSVKILTLKLTVKRYCKLTSRPLPSWSSTRSRRSRGKSIRMRSCMNISKICIMRWRPVTCLTLNLTLKFKRCTRCMSKVHSHMLRNKALLTQVSSLRRTLRTTPIKITLHLGWPTQLILRHNQPLSPTTTLRSGI